MLLYSLFECPTREFCQAQADHFSVLVTRSTIAVAIGVALEGVELIHDAVAWIKRHRKKKKESATLREVARIFPAEVGVTKESIRSDHPRWVKQLGRVGLILVVVGVVGEWRYGAKLEDVHNAIHRFDVALLTAADIKVGDAATSAKTAHEEANAVSKEADSIEGRLEIASRQLSDLEQAVSIQGPRWRLLEAGKVEFAKSLRPFAGQKVTVIKCGLVLVAEQERLEQDLLNFLGVEKGQGAQWAVESPGYSTWAKCNTGASSVGGNLVIVSSVANKHVKEAANALYDELNKIQISTVKTEAPLDALILPLAF